MVNHILWNNFFSKNSEKRKILRLLKNCYLFSTLSPKELLFLEKVIHSRYYQAHEVVFNQGDVGIGLYIVKSGSVGLYSTSQSFATEPSEQKTKETSEGEKPVVDSTRYFQTLKPGDFFGELALFEANERRAATAVAREETELLGFFKPDLLEVISRNPTTGSNIMLRLAEVLSRRLKESLRQLDQFKKKVNHQKIYK